MAVPPFGRGRRSIFRNKSALL